jgi:hypothetical protein
MLQAATISVVWVILYILNDWLFDHVAISLYASWVFLPAALRMLAVMLCGWVGVLGLFVGSVVTGYYTHGMTDPGMLVVLAGLSALTPMMAFLVCTRWFGWRADLRGLNATQLVVLSTLVSLFGATLHNLHLLAIGAIETFGPTFMTMFVGDMVGTFIVLYGAKFLLGLLPLDKQPTA